MDLAPVETPAPRMALAREAIELGHAAPRIFSPGQPLQVFADQLIQALAEGISLLAGAFDELLVERQGDVHEHRICVHVLCVKLATIEAESNRAKLPTNVSFEFYVSSQQSRPSKIGLDGGASGPMPVYTQ